MTDQLLIKNAISAKANAYAPYSKFKVGCAIMTNVGFYYGCNIENQSYPCGCCAEKAAIASMVADGCRKWDTLALIADKDDIKPCGQCLQVLSEFSSEGKILLVSADAKEVVVTTLKSLYPTPFSLKD